MSSCIVIAEECHIVTMELWNAGWLTEDTEFVWIQESLLIISMGALSDIDRWHNKMDPVCHVQHVVRPYSLSPWLLLPSNQDTFPNISTFSDVSVVGNCDPMHHIKISSCCNPTNIILSLNHGNNFLPFLMTSSYERGKNKKWEDGGDKSILETFYQ